MDKFDLLLQDVIDKTEAGETVWKPVLPQEYSASIPGSPFVYRCYEAFHFVDGERYQVLFIQKKSPVLNEDLGVVIERFSRELYFVEENLTLTKDYVEDDQLIRLGELIMTGSTRAKRLLDKFDKKVSVTN